VKFTPHISMWPHLHFDFLGKEKHFYDMYFLLKGIIKICLMVWVENHGHLSYHRESNNAHCLILPEHHAISNYSTLCVVFVCSTQNYFFLYQLVSHTWPPISQCETLLVVRPCPYSLLVLYKIFSKRTRWEASDKGVHKHCLVWLRNLECDVAKNSFNILPRT